MGVSGSRCSTNTGGSRCNTNTGGGSNIKVQPQVSVYIGELMVYSVFFDGDVVICYYVTLG